MSVTKLQNRDEFAGWYNEGRTYSWIIDKYREKYGIEIGTGTISNWRDQLGLPRRQINDPTLIPWAVAEEHQVNHLLDMLRAEARRRAGKSLSPTRLERLQRWLRSMEEDGAVVHYDPLTEEGWWKVPRRPGIDTDIIRAPEQATRQRGVRQ